jgi:hypothetical protein
MRTDGNPMAKRVTCTKERYGELVGSGKRGGHVLAPVTVGSRVGQLAISPVMWLLAPRPDVPSDMLAVIRAEDAFDVKDRLSGSPHQRW